MKLLALLIATLVVSSVSTKGNVGVTCKTTADCLSNGECDNTTTKCKCKVGFTANTAKTVCVPGNVGVTCKTTADCLSNGECDNTTTKCKCKVGFTANTAKTVCVPGNVGVTCKTTAECLSNGECDNTTTKCKCKVGFTANTAKTVCGDVNECNPTPTQIKCGIREACVNTLGSYRCECQQGFEKKGTMECIKKKCSSVYDPDKKIIKTWQYPYAYLDNEDCEWTISSTDGNSVNLTFTYFDLEKPGPKTYCTYDSVKVYDIIGNNRRILRGTWCGQNKPPVIVSETSKMEVTFTSDKSTNGYGFLAKYDFVEKPCGGDIRVDSDKTIKHPVNGFEQYGNAQRCRWTIHVENGYRIKFQLKDSELEEPDGNNKCTYDHLTVTNIKSNGHSGMQKIWCGKIGMDYYTSTTSNVELVFQSDETGTAKGFTITLSKVVGSSCHLDIDHTTNSGSIRPIKTDAPVCQWIITVDDGKTINLKFGTNFNLGNKKDGSCSESYIEIFDILSNDTSRTRGKWCGMKGPSHGIKSFGSKMSVIFQRSSTTDSPTFMATWSSDTTCGNTIESDEGHIMSYNYPGNANTMIATRCEWKIQAQKGYRIELTFEFPLDSPKCDQFRITDNTDKMNGDKKEANAVGQSWCNGGAASKSKFVSSRNQLNVIYEPKTSDAQVFTASWKSLCGGVHTTPSGNLMSPNYPVKYGNNLDCKWTIKAKKNHPIKISFGSQFGIEDGLLNQCLYDFVEVSDYDGKGPKKYCGQTSPPTFISYNSEIVLHFRSDSDKAQKGFMIHWDSTSTCGEMLSGNTGSLHFPYPKDLHNLNCTWTIRLDHFFHTVTLDFEDVDIGTDALKVKANNVEQSIKQSRTLHLDDPSSNINVVFLSKHAGHGTGFNLVWTTKCGHDYNGMQGTLKSPKFNTEQNYPNKLDCTWRIKGSNGKQVNLKFTDFNLEAKTNGDCKDFVKIWQQLPSGNKKEHRGTFCGNSRPPPMSIRGNAVLQFVSNEKTSSRGFSATYNVACGDVYTAKEGRFTSPNHPSVYPASVDCEWTIRLTGNAFVLLQFTTIDLPADTLCGDYIQTHELVVDNMRSNPKICASATTPMMIWSQSSEMKVNFHSDSKQNGRGFAAEWKTVTANKMTSPGMFKTPLHPAYYPKNSFVQWTIDGSTGWIKVAFEEFDLESDPGQCRYDYVEIIDYLSNGVQRSRGKWCGQKTLTEINSAGSKLTIRFYSDQSKSRKGFKANWTKEKICGVVLKEDKGQIMSPIYPSEYLHDQNCEWTIQKPTTGKKITLNFDSVFGIEKNSECSWDYVKVTCGDKLKVKTCGTNAPSSIECEEEMKVVFKSDDSNEDNNQKGFFASWKITKKSDATPNS